MKNWKPIGTAPENVEVWTRIYDSLAGERNVQTLVRKGNFWWHPDSSMYVYYQPTDWDYI